MFLGVILCSNRVPIIPCTTLRVTISVRDLGLLYQAVNSLSSCVLSIDDTPIIGSGSGSSSGSVSGVSGSGSVSNSGSGSGSGGDSSSRNSANENVKGNTEKIRTGNDGKENNHISRISEDYSEDATEIILRIKMPTEFISFFEKKVTDLCRGSAKVVVEEVSSEEVVDEVVDGEMEESKLDKE